jgi:AcrR family transcriptional regulator
VSLQQIAKKILISLTTIWYHLVNKMGYTIKHCKCVPQRLSAAQKQTRVTPSRKLLHLLHSVQH